MIDHRAHDSTATGQVLSIHVMVNGHAHDVLIEPYLTLIELIRDRLGLTGTKKSCDMQVCGVCTVLLNGRPVSACTMLVLHHVEFDAQPYYGIKSG
jgi:aerobic-type carbon monoxide dehydrogenase small subunit (CoxS/CutS family)